MTMFADWCQKYLFHDWEYMSWLLIAVAIDTVLGLWKHFKTKDANSKDFWNAFAIKIAVYMLLMILANLLQYVTVHGERVTAVGWISEYICTYMIVREAFSVVENIQAIYPIFPEAFVTRLKDFANNAGEVKNQEEES